MQGTWSPMEGLVAQPPQGLPHYEGTLRLEAAMVLPALNATGKMPCQQ